MSLKRVESLYRKMISFDASAKGKVNAGVRSELFHVIMEDIERLQKKITRLTPGTEEYRELDAEIRALLLKEIQVIMDDYMISRRNGTVERWQRMYGDIRDYVRNFYLYRRGEAPEESGGVMNKYGFYQHDRP